MGKFTLVPVEPPDEVAQYLSRLGTGFSVPERIDSGKEVYRHLLKLLKEARQK